MTRLHLPRALLAVASLLALLWAGTAGATTEAAPAQAATLTPIAQTATPQPTAAPTATPSPMPTTPMPEPMPTPRVYRGITEGDVIEGVATHYCPCYKCCKKTDGITASGFVVWRGMDDPYIVACNWLPFGSVVRINGIEYTVRDRGGDFERVGRVDIFTPSGHAEALKRGKPDVEIEIVRIGEG